MEKLLSTLFITLLGLSALAQNETYDTIKSAYDSDNYDLIISEYAQQANDLVAPSVYFIGMAYFMKADDNNCLKMMELTLQKDSVFADAVFIKGVTLTYLEQDEKAITEIEKAIRLDDSQSKFYSGLADAFLSMEQFENALIAYEKATQKENSIDRPFTMIPQIHVTNNHPEKALNAFYIAKNNISKRTESYVTVLFNIGLYEIVNRNYDKAELALLELLELAPNDYPSYSKLIQVYYGKKEYEKAEPLKEKLYNAYDKGLLTGRLKEMFCFDQFDWNDKLIQVFEKFEVREGELYYKHIFYVFNEGNKIVSSIQTENSPISKEMGGPKYAIGMDKGGSHFTFSFIQEDFKYEDLKLIVLQILNDEIKPGASSTVGSSKQKKKKKKK